MSQIIKVSRENKNFYGSPDTYIKREDRRDEDDIL